MRKRLAEITRGLAATATLLALLVGFPALLLAGVGWPMPEGIPSLDELSSATRSGIDPAVIVKTLAVIGWLAWAQIALAATIETIAFARRAPAPHLPVLPGLQAGTGRLLATAALLFGTFTTPKAAAEPLTPPPAVTPAPTLVAESSASTPASLQEDTVKTATPSAPTSTTTYIVQRNDSWWQIAEDHLGDGFRWREVRAVNIGRTMPDGHTVSAATEIIHAGWEIEVPAADDGGAALAVPAADVVVERGDNLWELSEEHLEDALGREAGDGEITPYWLDVMDENRAELVDPTNPSLIHPGQVFHLPGLADDGTEATSVSPAPTGGAPDGETGTPAPPTPDATDQTGTSIPPTPPSPPTSTTDPTPAQPGHQASGEPEDDSTSTPTPGLLGIAGALLGAGLSATVLRRRRQREQGLQLGERLADPPDELDEVRAEVVARGDIDLIAVTAASLQSVATELGRRRSAARARIVQASADAIEILLSEPVLPAPEPWQTEASGAAWVLQHATVTDLNLPAGLDGPTHPLLVTLGSPDDHRHLFLDLEAEGLINLTGSADEIASFARSAILELSTSPLAPGASMILCGPAGDLIDGNPDRVQRAGKWTDVADSVLAWAHQTRDLLVANRWPTAHTARAQGGRPDDAAPIVIVVTEEPDDERFSALCTVISESIIPVVVLGIGTAIEGATTIAIADGELRVQGLGLTCHAQGVTESAGAQITELLEHLDAAPPECVDRSEPVDAAAVTSDVDDEPAERYVDPPFDILVRVLGDIEVVGGHQPLTPKPTAIVTYVALNNPASAERVENAIWSTPTENRRKRLANTVSETRNALGAEHLPAATDGKYRVGERVITDLELLEGRLDAAREQPCEQATETLRGALDLVTGPVFTYRHADRHAYTWVDTENWISATELKVTALAEDLVERYLHLGDHDSAAWVANRGLAAVPTHARLIGALMRVYEAAGDPHAALSVHESYISALEALDLDDGDPDLADLYAAIRSGRRAAG